MDNSKKKEIIKDLGKFCFSKSTKLFVSYIVVDGQVFSGGPRGSYYWVTSDKKKAIDTLVNVLKTSNAIPTSLVYRLGTESKIKALQTLINEKIIELRVIQLK